MADDIGPMMHDGNTIHACAKKQGGDLRLVAEADSCLPSETAVEWSVQGPTGPQGASGVVGTHLHFATETSNALFFGVEAICEAGEVATGGGPRRGPPQETQAGSRREGRPGRVAR